MTASKNANNVAAAAAAGNGSTTSDGDYRLVPHEVLTSPTASYQVNTLSFLTVRVLSVIKMVRIVLLYFMFV